MDDVPIVVRLDDVPIVVKLDDVPIVVKLADVPIVVKLDEFGVSRWAAHGLEKLAAARAARDRA